MKITVLQGEEKGQILVDNNNYFSLSDIKLYCGDYTLETLLTKGISGLAINDFLLDEEMFDGVAWKYAVVGKKRSDTINLNLSVEKVDDKHYKLISNKKDVLGIDFSDNIISIGTEDIQDNNPTIYYEIAKLIYECVHRTRDYLEVFAIKMINEKTIQYQTDYRKKFFDKDLDNAIDPDTALRAMKQNKEIEKKKKLKDLTKDEKEKVDNKRKELIKNNKWAEGIKKWRENSQVDFSWQYLYFESIMCGHHYMDVYENRDVSKWKEDKDVNVEFSNFVNFVDAWTDEINNNRRDEGRKSPAKAIKDHCYDIIAYRNQTSHNIRETMDQDFSSIEMAIKHMQRIVAILGGENHGLYKKLTELLQNIEDIMKPKVN